MSIKIEGGDGTAENVIKAGASNELLYNDKEVLLKENFDLGLGLLPPDLEKTQEWTLKDLTTDESNVNPFTVPKDGWIVKVEFVSSSWRRRYSDFIKIDGFGELGITPSQHYIDNFITEIRGDGTKPIVYNLNCPYLVKEGQLVEPSENRDNNIVIITFAPCMSV